MKNILLVIIGIVAMFTMRIEIRASNFRYEINRVDDVGGNAHIRGWALSTGINHGSNPAVSGMKYFLEFYDNNTLFKVIESTNNALSYNQLNRNDDRKVDLTCLFFQNVDGLPNCLNVLIGRNTINGLRGQAGVEELMRVARARGISNFYYRDIGFEFIVNPTIFNLDCAGAEYDRVIRKRLNMRIRIQYPDNSTILSDRISIWESNISPRIRSDNSPLLQFLRPVPNNFKVIIDNGWVHTLNANGTYPTNVLRRGASNERYNFGKSDDPNVGYYSRPMTKIDSLFGELDPTIINIPAYARNNRITDLIPYRTNWYRVSGVVEYRRHPSGYWQVRPSLSDGLCPSDSRGRRGGCWVLGPWIVPEEGPPTEIGLKCRCQCPAPDPCGGPCSPRPPRPEPLPTQCPVVGPNEINFEPMRGMTFLDNLACTINGDETAFTEMPIKQTNIKAGMGFEYEVFVEGTREVRAHIAHPFDRNHRTLGAIIANYEAAERRLIAAQAILAAAQAHRDAVCGIPCSGGRFVPVWCTRQESYCPGQCPPSSRRTRTVRYVCGQVWEDLPVGCSRACNSAISALARARADYEAARRAYDAAKRERDNAHRMWLIALGVCNQWVPSSGFGLGSDEITVDHSFERVNSEENLFISQGNNGLVRSEQEMTSCNQPGCYVTRRYWFNLRNTYIESYTGEIQYLNEDPSLYPGHYINGGRKFFTDFDAVENKDYRIETTVDLNYHATWVLNDYLCAYSTIDDLSLYMFRPIALSNPFPEREPGYNWRNFKHFDFTRKNGQPIYDDVNIMYMASLLPNKMRSIRDYNINTSYLQERDDFGRNVFWTWSNIFTKKGGKR